MPYEKPSVSQTRPFKEENTGNWSQLLIMSPGVQLFLFGLLCTGAISAATATCTVPQVQVNIDVNQVYGDWFLGKAHGGANFNLGKTQCHPISYRKVNETTIEMTATYPGRTVSKNLTVGTNENAGTWQSVDGDRSGKVIYLSADGTTMAMAICMPNQEEPVSVLISKQLPISSEKIEEVRLALEQAGLSGHHNFTWESEATCPSA